IESPRLRESPDCVIGAAPQVRRAEAVSGGSCASRRTTMRSVLTDKQCAILRALCDTFVPSIRVQDDPTGFWSRKASDIGVDVTLAMALDELPEPLRRELIRFLEVLGEKDF